METRVGCFFSFSFRTDLGDGDIDILKTMSGQLDFGNLWQVRVDPYR